MDKIELKLDETNELIFKVSIEGTREPAQSIRFVCESDDVSYIFKGTTTETIDEVRVIVPPMTGRLKGGVYESKLEVIVEGRCLEPMTCLADFKAPPKVVAENVRVAAPLKQELKASASVIVARTKSEPVAEAKEAPVKHQTLAEKFGHRR